MRIAVLSDTHIPINAADLPPAVYEGITGADMILHAGDMVELSVFEKLSKIAPTRAVCGNMDTGACGAKLPKKDLIKINGVSIGLIHGWGPPFGLIELVKNEFKDEKVDAIVFGHSHTPISDVKDGILFFNPGSPTDKIFAPYNSYGMLEIEKGKITPRIIKI
ncbi:MAG: metallophosphoesterase family protein [Candidatus Omnitrophica bacterium]|nr:metallophosphoesterase family protein [Candidatus Omnitrophota bacterium]